MSHARKLYRISSLEADELCRDRLDRVLTRRAPGGGDTRAIEIPNAPVPGTIVIEKSCTGRGTIVARVLFMTVIDAARSAVPGGAEDVAAVARCTTTASGSVGTCTMTDIPLGND